MSIFFGKKDKLEGNCPDEFLNDAQLIKETREYTIDVVKYMEKMVRTATPHTTTTAPQTQQKTTVVPPDELQKLSKTCESVSFKFSTANYRF